MAIADSKTSVITTREARSITCQGRKDRSFHAFEGLRSKEFEELNDIVFSAIGEDAKKGNFSTNIRLNKVRRHKNYNEFARLIQDIGYHINYHFSNDSDMESVTISWKEDS